MNWQYKYTVLTIATFAFFATMVARLAISPLIPAITADFEITNAVIGMALTGMWLAYALTQFPSGLLGDRFGERPIILTAVGGTAVMCVVIAVAPFFWLFVICVILLGAVAGLHYSVATTLLTRLFNENVGFAIGVHTIGSPAAGLLAPIAAAWVGTQFGWRYGVAIGAVIAIPIFVLFAWRVQTGDPRRPNQSLSDQFDLDLLTSILARPQIAFTVGIAAVCAFVWQGIASFLPAFLIEYQGQSATFAGLIFSLYFIIQGVAKPMIGTISDRYGRDRMIAGCLIMTAAGLGLFVTGSGPLSIGLGVFLVGTGMGWSSAVEPRFMDAFAARERGRGFGLVRTTYLILGAGGSVVVGALADVFGWPISFGFLVLLLAGGAATVALNWILDFGY